MFLVSLVVFSFLVGEGGANCKPMRLYCILLRDFIKTKPNKSRIRHFTVNFIFFLYIIVLYIFFNVMHTRYNKKEYRHHVLFVLNFSFFFVQNINILRHRSPCVVVVIYLYMDRIIGHIYAVLEL